MAGALAAGALWVLVIADNKVFAVLGVHLVDPWVVRQLLQEGSWRDLALGRMTWASVLTAATVLALAHLVLVVALERRCRRRLTPRTALLAPLVLASLLPLATLAAAGSWTGGRWLAALRGAVGLAAPGAAQVGLRYPPPGLELPALRRRASVLVVVVESLRADAWGPEHTPELFLAAQHLPCMASPRHYSNGHETNGGLFSVLYALDAYYWPLVNAAGARSWPLAVLRRNGYELAAISASQLGGGRPSASWLAQFDLFKETMDHHDYHDDIELIGWLSAAARSGTLRRPFFALACLNSTHHNYHYPPEYERNLPVLPEGYDHFMGDRKLERFRLEITNRYLNSVLFVDHLLAGLLAGLHDEIERGELAVVITGDHGEELFDHGLLGHAASHLVDARTRVPLVLFAAGVGGRVDGVSGHTDILPTLLDWLQLDPAVEPATWSDGHSLLGAGAPPWRVVVTTAADSMLGNLRLALAHRGGTLVVDAAGLSGEVELRRAVDVKERPLSPVESERALEGVRAAVRGELFRFLAPDPREAR